MILINLNKMNEIKLDSMDEPIEPLTGQQINQQESRKNTDEEITSMYFKVMGAFNIIMRFLCIVSNLLYS